MYVGVDNRPLSRAVLAAGNTPLKSKSGAIAQSVNAAEWKKVSCKQVNTSDGEYLKG